MSSACFSSHVGNGVAAISSVGRTSSGVDIRLKIGTILTRFSGLSSDFFLDSESLPLPTGVAAALRTLLTSVDGLRGGGLLATF